MTKQLCMQRNILAAGDAWFCQRLKTPGVEKLFYPVSINRSNSLLSRIMTSTTAGATVEAASAATARNRSRISSLLRRLHQPVDSMFAEQRNIEWICIYGRICLLHVVKRDSCGPNSIGATTMVRVSCHGSPPGAVDTVEQGTVC